MLEADQQNTNLSLSEVTANAKRLEHDKAEADHQKNISQCHHFLTKTFTERYSKLLSEAHLGYNSTNLLDSADKIPDFCTNRAFDSIANKWNYKGTTFTRDWYTRSIWVNWK